MRLERRVLEREVFMQYFEKQGNALIFRQDGETVRVEPWQKDSLRVRGTLLSEIEEGSIALLDPEPVEAEIELVDERKATIKNGKIQAILELQPWGQKLRITFLNQKGEVLLSEIANGGALCLRAHDYRALKGGAYQLKVSFDSNPDEKIYGMGQYQQERMNLKGCNLELRTAIRRRAFRFMYRALATASCGTMQQSVRFISEQTQRNGWHAPQSSSTTG